MKLQQNKGNGQLFINLPAQLCKAMGWIKGQQLDIRVQDKGKLLIYEKSL